MQQISPWEAPKGEIARISPGCDICATYRAIPVLRLVQGCAWVGTLGNRRDRRRDPLANLQVSYCSDVMTCLSIPYSSVSLSSATIIKLIARMIV